VVVKQIQQYETYLDIAFYFTVSFITMGVFKQGSPNLRTNGLMENNIVDDDYQNVFLQCTASTAASIYCGLDKT
jgi:hypothetical protein